MQNIFLSPSREEALDAAKRLRMQRREFLETEKSGEMHKARGESHAQRSSHQ